MNVTAEDGIRDVERSRGLGDVYKRQHQYCSHISLKYLLLRNDSVPPIFTESAPPRGTY